MLAAAFLFAVPGILFAVYYLHFFDRAAWFYELRAVPFSELAAAGAGLLAGVLTALLPPRGTLITRPFLVALLVFGIAIPYLKPVIAPVRAAGFQDWWADGVCLQSTASSCGPASAATLLRAAGRGEVREADIAGACFTYVGGTENWYLARFLRRQGCTVRFLTGLPPEAPLPVPSIAGIRCGAMGHFIPILAETSTSYVTGDPLAGRREWPKDKIRSQLAFTGFFMEVRAGAPGAQSRAPTDAQSTAPPPSF